MRLSSVLAGFAAIALVPAIGATSPSAQVRGVETNPERTIEVTGEASVEATPDFARLTLGVTTSAKDAGEAMAANARAVSALIATLKGEGVAPADIQTASLSIEPTFSNPSPGSAARPVLVGYRVGNMVTVTARDLARLGELIDKAVENGANAIDGVAFGETDPGALLDKARPLAFADAKRKAEIYAAAAGARIGRLMDLSEQVDGPSSPYPRRIYAAAAKAAPPPIEAGQDKLTVGVTARFELTQ